MNASIERICLQAQILQLQVQLKDKKAPQPIVGAIAHKKAETKIDQLIVDCQKALKLHRIIQLTDEIYVKKQEKANEARNAAGRCVVRIVEQDPTIASTRKEYEELAAKIIKIGKALN